MVTAPPWPLAIRGLLWARHVLDIHLLADRGTSSPGLSHDLADPHTWLPPAQPLHLKSNRQLRLRTSHTSPDVIPPTCSSCSLPLSGHGNPTGVDLMPSFVSYFLSGPSAPVGSTIKTHAESHHFYHFHPLPPWLEPHPPRSPSICPWPLSSPRSSQRNFLKTLIRGFPGGAVVKNLPANAGDTGSSPGLGRSHMPRSN